MRRIAGSFVFLALLALSGSGASGASTGAQHADFDARCEEARAALQRELDAYAEWCRTSELFNERRKALELVLELDPRNAEAHKALGHVRAKDGSWQVPEKPKAFRDFDKQALAEAPARWKAVTGGYVGAMLALLESKELSCEQRERAAANALRLDPENERVHALIGDVRGEHGWVLPETVAAKAQREVLRGQVKRALEGAPPVDKVPLTEREQRIPLKLTAFAAPRLRAVGTVGADELRLAAQAVLGVENLLQAVFASTYALPEDCTLFLLTGPADRQVFLANHPSIPPEQRPYYEKLESSGIQGTGDFVSWTGDMQARIDGLVRLTLGYWLTGAFQITVDHGWAYEGFGLVLTRALVRTRMTWMAQPASVLASHEDFVLRQKLIDPATNWMDEALQLLRSGRQGTLVDLFKKDASALTTEDVLHSYALATYLLEARAECVGSLLGRIGRGQPPASVLQEALGLDLAAIERRVVRWLGERT